MVGGTTRKLVVNGVTRRLSNDSDPKFTVGGTYISEIQQTNTGEPVALFDKIAGALTGIEDRISSADGTLGTLEDAVAACVDDGYVSASITMPDGNTWSASGGALLVIDGPEDGYLSLREGKVTYALYPVGGVWTQS